MLRKSNFLVEYSMFITVHLHEGDSTHVCHVTTRCAYFDNYRSTDEYDEGTWWAEFEYEGSIFDAQSPIMRYERDKPHIPPFDTWSSDGTRYNGDMIAADLGMSHDDLAHKLIACGIAPTLKTMVDIQTALVDHAKDAAKIKLALLVVEKMMEADRSSVHHYRPKSY